MDGEGWETWLSHVTGAVGADADILCLFLIHNEAHLLRDLFAHYRRMGNVHFMVVDDRSTDETRSFLTAQPDVTVFEPRESSTYARDKREWRGALLDAYANGRWCLVIDADERLIWRGAPARTLSDLIKSMESAGKQALIATMLDMYADCPIAEHLSGDADLAQTFDRFDDPTKDVYAYRATLSPSSFRKRFPSPNTILMGGMRDRLFRSDREEMGLITRLLQKDAIHRPRHIPARDMLIARIAARFSAPRGDLPPLNLTKVPLVKWQHGMRYNGGAHHLSRPIALSREYGVLLHYPFTRGESGISYIAKRGQHAAGGGHYKSVLDKGALSALNPVYSGTSVLKELRQLEPFFGHPAP